MEQPSYIAAFKNGLLRQKADEALAMLGDCRICPRRCGVNRLKNQKGFCRTGRMAAVCSAFAHHGEEPPLSGEKGAGAIFFSHCNMRCVYCQNFQFSQKDEGEETPDAGLADIMLSLQRQGCHNINFITPTHIMPQILLALHEACRQGLNIPLVYNTSGYECKEMIDFLDGIIDIYMPDMRYADEKAAIAYSSAPGYPAANQNAVRAMFHQVGLPQYDTEEIMTRGLLIRHLVLPENISGTEKIFSFIAKNLSRDIPISLMSQYFPAFEAQAHPSLQRRITLEEYEAAIALLKKYGLENGWIQESGGLQRFAGIHIKKNIS
jgi:putative pyruvate formate lyase activating enzyme